MSKPLHVLAFVILVAPIDLTSENWNILEKPAHNLLYQHLLAEAGRQFDTRRKALSQAFSTPAAALKRRDMLKVQFLELLGGFPDKTPLKALTMGVIDCDGYRIEKVIYESRARHHVTANLYLPTRTQPPFPGVLVPCGHSVNGKAEKLYQSACILLARQGMAALIYDPISQGERNQIPHAPRHGTTEHSLVGVGALLVGQNTGHFRSWDGIRSLDYLASRPEVDPERLGCTGNSGGGTMTTWLMAADDRIKAAAPSCFVTSLEKIFATIGPADCEQHFPGMGSLGMEHADFVMMRAPQPTIILAAEQDFFDFNGTRTAFEEARKMFGVLGMSQRVAMFSYNDKHGFSQPRREAAAAWMSRWLLNTKVIVREPKPKLLSDDMLQVTRTGQVVSDFKDELIVPDFTLQRAHALEPNRKQFSTLPNEEQMTGIRKLLGLRQDRKSPRFLDRGAERADEDRIQRGILHRDGEPPLPMVVCLPKNVSGRMSSVIYLDSHGKTGGLARDGIIHKWVEENQIVIAVDLRGWGETRDRGSKSKYYNDEFRISMLSMHIGRPLLGQRVEDVTAVLDYLQTREDVDMKAVDLVGVDKAGPVALHTAVLDDRIRRITIQGSIRSWIKDVVARPLGYHLIGHVVPGALEKYDLPDLALKLEGRLVFKN